MTITFVGFYRPASPEFLYDYQRNHEDTFPPEFQEKIRGLPATLPETMKLVGSWGVTGGDNPGVMVVEAESFADLQVVNQHYSGWLNFDWHPTNTGGVPRD